MIDKHRLSKIAVTNILRGTILYWFHVMKTIGKTLINETFHGHYGKYNIKLMLKNY